MALVRLSEPKLGRYVCRFLSPGSSGNNQIWASQSGQSKPGLTLQNLWDFTVALPPTKVERNAHRGGVERCGCAARRLDRLIAKKRDLKQAAMQQLLTGQTRLPGFHAEWEVKRLGDTFRSCAHGVNSRGAGFLSVVDP